METVEKRAVVLRATVEHGEDERSEEITAYAETVAEAAGSTREALSSTDFGTFRAVSLTIDYDDSEQIYAGDHPQ